MPGPLAGVRVLSMEQAAALPYATRHLVDLGAEVIRVQAPQRSPGGALEPSLFRGKRMLGLNLAADDGPEVFRRLAANCDIVAHNYTPRVMRKYGIDFDAIRAVNPQVIYCALTGFGSSGPWSDRPLFGPGAEAISGHNLLIGESSSATPGRPGTVTYADFVCGTSALLAMLAALHDKRVHHVTAARFIDVCLYETAIAQLGPVLCERALGAPLPTRNGNADARYALHGVWRVRGDATRHERYVAIAATSEQLSAVFTAIGIHDVDAIASRLAACDGGEIVTRLQRVGVAAALVADAMDIATNEYLWARGYFGFGTEASDDLPQPGPAWGGGAATGPFEPARAVGADNADLLQRLAHYSATEVVALRQRGVVGEAASEYGFRPVRDQQREMQRGFIAAVDAQYQHPWRAIAATTSQVSVWHVAGEQDANEGASAPRKHTKRVLELPGSIASAYAARLFADQGWDVVTLEPQAGTVLRGQQSRWGGGTGGAHLFVNRGKRVIQADRSALLAFAAASDVVIGDLREEALAALGVARCDLRPISVCASVSPFGAVGLQADWQATELTMQAASGFMFITGEHDEVPQQMPPYAAEMVAGITSAAAIFAALIAADVSGLRQHLDLAVVEALTAFVQSQHGRYVATGEISRREGAVKHALRMAPALDGFVYCAPGAVATSNMDGLVKLLGDRRLADPRFVTAEGRMDHFAEYRALLREGFAQRSAQDWFERAGELHLTFALVQNVDALLACPQLRARRYFTTAQSHGVEISMPGLPFRMTSPPSALKTVPK